MAVIEIQAKTMLASIHPPDGIFGMRYNMNLYRGCQHQCIYCDSRSLCYEIENFADILVKVNALELLEKELPRKRVKGPIGTGSMNDPYMPVEKTYRLTRGALEIIAKYGFGVHVNTKSDLVLRDLDLLQQISRVHTTVGFSITMTDDDLGRKLEPGAPPPSARFAALRALTSQGICAGVLLMPVLPFLLDTPENVRGVIEKSVENGAAFIIPWFGMSMRDRQRAYYYEQLDRLFPGLRAKYERAYGERYECPARGVTALGKVYEELRAHYGFLNRVPVKQPPVPPQQLSLFEA
jgi:DNA repair photolyase